MKKLMGQKLVGIFFIAAGIMACVLEPQEGGTALLMFGGLGATLLLSKKRIVY